MCEVDEVSEIDRQPRQQRWWWCRLDSPSWIEFRTSLLDEDFGGKNNFGGSLFGFDWFAWKKVFLISLNL
jgi:hypothetical protein